MCTSTSENFTRKKNDLFNLLNHTRRKTLYINYSSGVRLPVKSCNQFGSFFFTASLCSRFVFIHAKLSTCLRVEKSIYIPNSYRTPVSDTVACPTLRVIIKQIIINFRTRPIRYVSFKTKIKPFFRHRTDVAGIVLR